RDEPMSSAGLGGMRPAGNTQRPDTDVLRTVSLALERPTSRFERPGSLDTPRASCTFGLRMSASIKRTRCPACARPTAILASTILFPSPGPVLVTTTAFEPS